jgi:hypothetical protein
LWANQEIRIKMTKNMTRRGLAFGATIALSAGLFSAVPAVAAGNVDGSVTLVPNVGLEYSVRSNDAFDLKSNYDASLTSANRYLKFLVADTASKTKVDVDNNGNTGDVPLTTITGVTSYAIDTLVVTVVTAAAHKLQPGDVVAIALMNAGTGTGVVTDGDYTVVSTPSTTSFTFDEADATDVVATADADATIDAVVTAQGLNTRAQIVARGLGSVNVVGGSFPVSARSTTDNSYVVTGIANSVAADQVVRLVSTDTTQTVSVDVTAWVDNNGNDLIDATEKASATRTVSFVHSTGITATTTIRPATAGESTVTADVMTTPTLNGLMILDAINENLTVTTVTTHIGSVKFTRQGDATEVVGVTNGSYSNTTNKFTFTSVNFNDAGWTDTAATLPATLAGAGGDDLDSYSITANVANVVFDTPHGYRVGDIVNINAAEARLDNTTAKITAVPTTKSFQYALTTANAGADVASTDVAEASVLTDVTILRNSVEAGALTAQFFFDGTGALTTGTTLGAAGTYNVGAQVVATGGISLTGAPSATVNAAGKVAKGTTTATATVALTDSDSKAVGAGVDVTITAIRAAGASTVTAGGLAVGSSAAVTFYGKTDANGEVAIALTNTVGAVNDQINLTADSQGATQATLSVIWEDKVYSIHDTADATYANSSRVRAVAVGSAYTFNLIVQDQWKAPAGADVRLKATLSGRTVQTSIIELTDAAASFTVIDGGLTTGDVTVQVDGQIKSATSGLWATTDASFTDWAAGEDLTVAVKYQAAAAITLNAQGANFPSTTAADYTADATTLTPVALDGRVSYAAAPAFLTAEKAVVSGSVNLANGVVAAGTQVTISGVGLGFKVGDVWALDSVSFVNDGTFAVEVYSRSSGAKTVTLTSGTVTKTATVTFAAVAGTTGYSIVLTTPETVQRGSTFKVEGQVLDVNGNGLSLLTAGTGAAATLQVSYLGLGLVSGALPTTTDATGKFFFYVLVGTNDVGTSSVTASYDVDGTGTVSAAVVATKTIYVGQSAPSANKVNVGSFKGYVALYAKGYEGQKMSAIVAGKWIVVESLASDFERVVRFTGAGYTITTKIYIDGVQVGDAFTTVTK